MSGMENRPLLSICIPTWNRAKFLRMSLESFFEQMHGVESKDVELFVSDNCSDDETPSVVEELLKKGLPITYNRNEKNIGAAGNFVKCMQWASGKYIYLLGDDDILVEGALKYLLDVIRDKDYGLIHIHDYNNLKEEKTLFTDVESFLKQMSYWVTFMSGSVFRKDIVSQIDSSKYIGTHLLQVPYYIKSALSREENLIIKKNLLQSGLDASNNGGYNFYEVFVKNYLTIWKEFAENRKITWSCYEFLRKDIYEKFIVNYNYRFFILHQDIKENIIGHMGNRHGFIISGAKQILEDYYANEVYYKLTWLYYIRIWLRHKKQRFTSCVKSKVRRINHVHSNKHFS